MARGLARGRISPSQSARGGVQIVTQRIALRPSVSKDFFFGARENQIDTIKKYYVKYQTIHKHQEFLTDDSKVQCGIVYITIP